MKIEEKLLTEIKPYVFNPRKNKRGIDMVKKSIEKYGFKVPIIVDKNNEIVAGHTRYQAAKLLKLEKVPCVVADNLTDKQIKEFRIAENRTHELSIWDTEMLSLEMKDLDLEFLDIDIKELLKVDKYKVENIFGHKYKSEDDIRLNDNVETKEDKHITDTTTNHSVKYGDIYQLGRHRVMCGDSLNNEDVAKLMNGKKAQTMIADPPYFMKKKTVLNDNIEQDEEEKFTQDWLNLSHKHIGNNASCFVFGGDKSILDLWHYYLRSEHIKENITFKNLITWDKKDAQGVLSSQFSLFPRQCEFILFYVIGKYTDTTNTNKDEFNEGYADILKYQQEEFDKIEKQGLSRKELAKELKITTAMIGHYVGKTQFMLVSPKTLKKIKEITNKHGIECFENYLEHYEKARGIADEVKQLVPSTDSKIKEQPYFNNIFESIANIFAISSQTKEREDTGNHETPKPLKLLEKFIKATTKQEWLIYDPFGGSGSTLIASEQLNRTCYTMELNPYYVDIIIKRYEKHTGGKALKL